jgi:hypothetical protein
MQGKNSRLAWSLLLGSLLKGKRLTRSLLGSLLMEKALTSSLLAANRLMELVLRRE